MIRMHALAISVFVAGWLLAEGQTAPEVPQIMGEWSLTPSPQIGHVQLTLHWKSSRHSMNSTMEWSLTQLEGLSPEQLKGVGTNVRFRLSREAGALNCEGYVKNGSGGGVFNFAVSRTFVDAMSKLGYSNLGEEQLLALAVHDVTTTYIREIRAESIQINGINELLAMRIHNVTVGYVRDMKRLGFNGLSSQKLIAMRIHGVTPEFAGGFKQLGYPSVTTDQLVAMRIHGASLDLVRDLAALGYKNPTIDQLLALRIHDVTPDRIRNLQKRGMTNLPIDKLLSLRIHGLME
jgi:hypothetical protein